MTSPSAPLEARLRAYGQVAVGQVRSRQIVLFFTTMTWKEIARTYSPVGLDRDIALEGNVSVTQGASGDQPRSDKAGHQTWPRGADRGDLGSRERGRTT